MVITSGEGSSFGMFLLLKEALRAATADRTAEIDRCLSGVIASRIVFCAEVFKAKRPDRRYLRDVFTGFRPVEMGRITGQNDDATGRIRLEFIGVELITQADVENAGYHGVNSILRVPVWHQLHTVRHFDPDGVGAGLRGMTDNHCQANRRRERREWFPIDVFRQDRSELVLARLVRSSRAWL
jgi:hypothetical protein